MVDVKGIVPAVEGAAIGKVLNGVVAAEDVVELTAELLFGKS